jgi:hypothetical protein
MNKTKIEFLSNLTGNMRRCCEHAANGPSKIGLRRREIVAGYARIHKSEDRANKRAEKLHPTTRTANVRKVKDGFRVIGLGFLPFTKSELMRKLRMGDATRGFRGCNFYRINGMLVKVPSVG